MRSEPLFKSLIHFSVWGDLIYLKGFKKDSSCGEADYSDAIAAQVRRLAMGGGAKQLALARQITVLNGISGQLCNIASLAISAVTLRHGDMVTYCRRYQILCA